MNLNQDDNRKIKKKKQTSKKKSAFEYCEVCRLNHDQGQRHKYFPRHKQSLCAFLDRLKAKVADVRFFLENPSVLRPEYAHRNCFWCVFCDEELHETGSAVASCNAIKHLASDEHVNNLKTFLWKHGGGMHCIDKLRISLDDVSKWEKKCCSLKSEAVPSSKQSAGLDNRLSNDIHNELNFKSIDSNAINPIHLPSIQAGCVMPLQNNTNEYQIPPYEPSRGIPSNIMCAGNCLHSQNYEHARTNFCNRSNLTGATSSCIHVTQLPLTSSCLKHPVADCHGEVRKDVNEAKGASSSVGLQCLTRVSPVLTEGMEGNVHSGGRPPWLDSHDSQNSLDGSISFAKRMAKSQKLNPKRVGAEWAEKRKLELEMEKRGQMSESYYDADWLPNFGRVWQSGSRKESRKEFENGKMKSAKLESTSDCATQPYVSKQRVGSAAEMAMQLQPYVSKRWRMDDGGC